MAPHREGDDNNNAAVSSKPLPEEETTTNKKQKRVAISSETLAPPSLPSTSNPPPLPTVPSDLVVEILCRLPVKSLLRFRCVCKSWNSLISDPKFAKKHFRSSQTDFTRHRVLLTCLNPIDPLRELLLTTYPLQSVYDAAVTATATKLRYPLDEQNRILSIVGSCDGILCLDLYEFVILWNPSTQRFKKLPSLKNPRLKSFCYTSYGFGYDYLADSYKVVAVFCYECDYGYYKTRVKVHTLGTDSWRRIQKFPSDVPDESGKFVSGTLNWLLSVDSNWVVVSLDLGKETYHELILPVDMYAKVYMTFEVVLTLGVLRDCLCIIANHDTYFDEYSDVWLMKEYGNTESWTKLFSVRKLSITYPKILHMSEDKQVLLELEDNLVLYNSRDDTFKTTQIQNGDCMLLVPEVYVESLISPCSLF